MKKKIFLAVCSFFASALLAVLASAKQPQSEIPEKANPETLSKRVEPGPQSGRATPLHDAVNAGDVERVKLEIRTGSDVNPRDGIGQTPFHLVMRKLGSAKESDRKKYLQIAVMLDKAGADWRAKDRNEKRACEYAPDDIWHQGKVVRFPRTKIPPEVKKRGEKAVPVIKFPKLKLSDLIRVKIWACQRKLYPWRSALPICSYLNRYSRLPGSKLCPLGLAPLSYYLR